MRLRDLLRLRALFAGMIAVLVAATLITYWAGNLVVEANRDIILQLQLIDDLDQTMSSLKDAETGQRGYLLTGDESYLAPYRAALGSVQEHLVHLQEQAEKGLRDPRNIERLTNATKAKMEELDQTINLRREQGADAAVAVVRTGRGAVLMDELRQMVKQLVTRRINLLNEEQRRAGQLTLLRTTVFVVSGVVEILFCLWAYLRIVKGIRHQAEAATELRRQKDLLAVTLASIGDAVMVTDMSSRITFMNSVAEALTGWKFAEAKGRMIHEVFHIINEGSRKAVENPVDKVMRLGMVVGLANHTLLMRKDGSELPIDDSGAPIRDGGQVYGAVLVFRDFTEHKQAERELRAARAQAESANRAKDRFLATLSHELRTPLTPVVATLDMWQTGGEIPEHLKADVHMLRRNVELEVRLIDDLLDLTKIAQSKLPLKMQSVDMHDAVQSVVGIVQGDMGTKKQHMTMHLAATRQYVRGDSARLQQVLWNIMKNAVKFTDEGGEIVVETMDTADGQIEIRVSDTGIGMSGETLRRIFRPFEQGPGETARRYGGLGLGMAISKSLVEEQGGQITAFSEGVGHGSTFVVSFPTMDTPGMEHEVRETHRDGAHPTGGDGSRGRRILLVEDHEDTARALNRVLERLGYKVRVANTIKEAMEAVEQQSFDLLLSDLGLPDGTGLELVRQVQARQPVPAVALTGFGMEEDVARSREAGFSAHLTKPVNFQKLQMTIQDAMDGG